MSDNRRDKYHERGKRGLEYSENYRKRKRSRSPKPKEIFDYKYELRTFLKEQGNIKNLDDFWKFYGKFSAAKAVKKSDFDRSFLLNVDFTAKLSVLYERLPVLDKNGIKLHVNQDQFKEFLLVIRLYRDFQQKLKFSKLKQLRKTQSDLPIAQYKQELIEKLNSSRVLLIAGDTGCGKSTQVPQYVFEAGFTKIACTQPRRIACISLSKRVAYETLTEHKNTVGYQIKFEKSKRADTNIIFLTEGLLLRQASEEITLNSYDCIILDEVHERHLYSDFLVGIMKCLLYKRDDFKLILMSATINLDLFKKYFENENISILQVPGRLYPIEINYRPIVQDLYDKKRAKFDCTPYLQIIQLIDNKYPPNQKGDMLIFLNGFSEINSLSEAVNEYSERNGNRWIVLMLHSTLSIDEQDKVFDYPPDGIRKCVISTNIAETSVTIDGIRFVMDSGRVNRMTYTFGGINKLTETCISQDSAKQRAGRAGRTGPGVCYRLYSEEEFAKFDPFTPAEIHLVPLDSLLLYMISLGLNDVEKFPFLERPSDKSIKDAVEKLKFIEAISSNGDHLQITLLGNALSNIPVDLTIGKILITSTVFGQIDSILALAAILSIQSPITQSSIRNTDANNLRKPMESSHGDPFSYLNFYKEWLGVKLNSTPVGKDSRAGAPESSKKWSKKRCLEEQRFYETTKLIERFRDILDETGLTKKGIEAGMSSNERAIRHGELKHLKSMRYEIKRSEKEKRRKQLKIHDEDDATEETADIRDVEFRITNDFQKLHRLLSKTHLESAKDVILLKLVLASGLYPNVALPDEHNTKQMSPEERLFHTRQKGFVSLRPDSCFVSNSDLFDLNDDEIEVPPLGYFSKRPLSRKHQILMFQSVLETKKVYLMNTFRMPAIQSLMLFAKTIATNRTLTRFVFDDFVLIDAPFYNQGKKLLIKAVQYRKMWKYRLEQRLNGKFASDNDESRDIFYFIEDLVNFMTTEVCYNIKRLLPADIKLIYKADNFDLAQLEGANPFDSDYSVTKSGSSGYNVSENVVYACLIEDEFSMNLEMEICSDIFECVKCGVKEIGFSLLDRIRHEETCTFKKETIDKSDNDAVGTAKKNARVFDCEKCQKTLLMTPVEILKHKKNCC